MARKSKSATENWQQDNKNVRTTVQLQLFKGKIKSRVSLLITARAEMLEAVLALCVRGGAGYHTDLLFLY